MCIATRAAINVQSSDLALMAGCLGNGADCPVDVRACPPVPPVPFTRHADTAPSLSHRQATEPEVWTLGRMQAAPPHLWRTNGDRSDG